ncbi:MAG: hypothetical protein HY234_01475 [Acidobacteria bacterium]|nr:hypothetical protein [Acidobacteriota bacterium]
MSFESAFQRNGDWGSGFVLCGDGHHDSGQAVYYSENMRRRQEGFPEFVRDLGERITGRSQIATDGFRAYIDAIELHFGADLYGCRIDFVSVVMLGHNPPTMLDAEEFSARSTAAIHRLLASLNESVEHLKASLPLRIALFVRFPDEAEENLWSAWIHIPERKKEIWIWFRCLITPPEPKELYPVECIAIGTVQTDASESCELCCSEDRWLILDGGRWLPFSGAYLAYLIGRASTFSEPAPDE